MASVQSIQRAFRLLQALADEPAGITELSRRVDLPTSTVARILATLEKAGAAERIDDGSTYRIGPAVRTMGARADPGQDLYTLARPHMVDLVDQLFENVGLSIPSGYEMQYVGQANCANPVQIRDWTGASLPMHIVPSGLVVLAYWPDGAIDRFLGRRLDRYTANTETRPERIRKRLTSIRRDGYVWCHEEYSEGINSVAAPIFDDGLGVVGALHCHGPSYRFPDESMRDIAAGLVKAGAAAVSSDLGRRS